MKSKGTASEIVLTLIYLVILIVVITVLWKLWSVFDIWNSIRGIVANIFGLKL